MTRLHNALKAANLLAYVVVVVVNIVLPVDPNHDGKNIIKTHILPANYTFGIWGLIYALLGGFVIYQWFPSANDATINGIQWFHVVASVLNVTWLAIYPNHELIILDAFVLLALFLVLFHTYNNLSFHTPKNFADRIFIHYSFTIYAAWSAISTVLNFWAAFPKLDTVILSTIAVAVLGLVGLSWVDYHNRHDVVFAGTIAWALAGIAFNHVDVLPILVSASVSSGLIFGATLRVWIHQTIAWFRLRNQRLDERTRLLD